MKKTIKIVNMFKFVFTVAVIWGLVTIGGDIEKSKRVGIAHKRAANQVADYEHKKRSREYTDSSLINWVIGKGYEVVLNNVN